MARNAKAEAVMAAMTRRWWNSGWYEEGIKQIGRTTALDLRRADSGLFRDLLAAEQLVGFQDHLLQVQEWCAMVSRTSCKSGRKAK